MLPVIQLALSPDGSERITETFPTFVVLKNHQISIQLKIRVMKSNEAAGFSTIQSEITVKCNSSDKISNSSYQQPTTHRRHTIHAVLRAEGDQMLY
ncbi:hypothetical protein TNCV_2231941 [Trichonephila clavipes]|nr:hypothetical protein TNCV_2231941 [Trichonephila clavipes]